MAKGRKKALGKGMERLMQIYQAGQQTAEEIPLKTDPDYMPSCLLKHIHPNPNQPRKIFSEEDLEDLTQSIKINGLLQPILTRKVSEHDYEIVAGERRYRACKRAGLTEIPIFVKTLSDQDVLILSLIENVQRQDLTPIEEAKAYAMMIEAYNLTQQEISDAVSKSRATVANSIRLLKLPEVVQDLISHYEITAGHAKLLLSLDDQDQMILYAQKVVAENLSVRALEKLLKENHNLTKKEKKLEKKEVILPEVSTLIHRLKNRFNTNIKINHKNKRGKITIEYRSMEELERLSSMLLAENEQQVGK